MHKLIRKLRYIAPLVFLIFLVLAFNMAPKLLKINEVLCESQFGPCEPEVDLELQEIRGASLTDAKKDISDFLSQKSTVRSFTSRLQLPDKIKVDLILKKAELGLYNGQGQVALVDRDGVVLSYSEKTQLPILKIEGKPPSVGEKADKTLAFAIHLFAYLNKMFDITEGSLESGAITFSLKDGPRVIVPTEGDQKVLIGGLMLIVNELNKGGLETKMESSVDLRYKNPVVRI